MDKTSTYTLRLISALALIVSARGLDAAPVHVWNSTFYYTGIGFLPPSEGGNSGQIFDPSNDQQTGDPAADFVGNTTNNGFYVAFNDHQDAVPTTGTLLFRFRMGDMHSSGAFSSAAIVGIDANGDGQIDLFVGYDGRGGVSSRGVRYWAGNCSKTPCNTSPSTTGLGTENGTVQLTSNSNHHYALVTNVINPGVTNTNIDAGGSGPNANSGTDAFMTFAADLARLRLILPTLTDTTPLRFIAVTSQQDNSFNQDLGGCATVGSAVTWVQCGMSTTYALNNLIPSPEPSAIGISGIGIMALLVASRKLKKR